MNYPLLSTIKKAGDIKDIPADKLDALCAEIRSFLIESVSATGGHLSSNLGVIELTVALHYVLDLKKDRILFDVGHQCYTHKLLTGRKKDFAGLRMLHGISGFPCPDESPYDIFVAGHGSTALSAAIGVAQAKKIKGEAGKVIVLIGDGAFTGGMVYEGLNNVGHLNNLIVILNDNKMSISKNVGALAHYFTQLRTKPEYNLAKARAEVVLDAIPVLGKPLINVLQSGKKMLRQQLYHSTMFEEMGFQYIGPVDGHNTRELCTLFRNLKKQVAPVFIHAVTVKGRGFQPAEENPGEFHGVSAFDTSHLTNPEVSPTASFSAHFGAKLADLGALDKRICAVTAAMKYGTGLQFFYHAHPTRFFDVGMAEEHAVTFAAGLATQGMLPVVAIYSTFLQRAYDQIIHDVNLMKLNVLFAVDRAGFVPGDGETHQGIYDTGFFRQIGIPEYAPCNYDELDYWLEELLKISGPKAIRYPRGGESEVLAKLGCTKKAFDVLPGHSGAKTALVGYGALTEDLLAAAEQVEGGADVIKMVQLNPLPDTFIDTLCKYEVICMAEDSVRAGSVGDGLGLELARVGWKGRYLQLGVDNTRLVHANVKELKMVQGLDSAGILRALKGESL